MRTTKPSSIRHYLMKNGDLVQYNQESKVYKKRNNIEHIDTRLTEEFFLENVDKQIKRGEFSRLMNEFFKNVKHQWRFENTDYEKADNFEDSEYCLSVNYEVHKFPRHTSGKHIMVYHWGRVYYHTISYNGYKQGQLINIKTGEYVRWAQLKHCAPVRNVNTKQIV